MSNNDEVYLEDIHEAEGALTRARNAFLDQRGWKSSRQLFRDGLSWSKAELKAEHLTTDEAISAEVSFGKNTLRHPVEFEPISQ